ncbi:MAG: hypothetical protein HC905_08770, partial [Bacteroidales bacterium]|nr:hypothetical protein [Bacteroidales bacterium]
MDRNSIIGIVLIAGILFLWTFLNKPSKEELARREKMLDSIELVRQYEAEKVIEEQHITQDSLVKVPDSVKIETLQQEFDNFAQAAVKCRITTIYERHY